MKALQSFLLSFLVLIGALQVSRLIFHLQNASLYEKIQYSDLPLLLFGGLRYDLTILSLCLIPLVIVFFIKTFFNRIPSAIHYALRVLACSSICVVFLMNSADTIYFSFTLHRSTSEVFSLLHTEANLGWMLFSFAFFDYPVVFFTGVLLSILSIFAINRTFKKIELEKFPKIDFFKIFLLSVFLVFFGIRGHFNPNVRPLTLSESVKYVSHPSQQALVLNTPFSIFRSFNQKDLPLYTFFSEDSLKVIYEPILSTSLDSMQEYKKKNVIIFILESFSSEYMGCLNGGATSYTPFLDSLVLHSDLYINVYANGRKSIEALPSILAGLPSYESTFITSPYSSNSIYGLPMQLKERGYKTSFFHGAHNGSMGFDSFAKQAGCDNIYGMDEYPNKSDFDGRWGIWDHCYLNFFVDKLDRIQEPFFSTFFTLSSHQPFSLPDSFKYFQEGSVPIHKTILYTDRALEIFFDRSKNCSWYENTIFLFVADHASISNHPDFQHPLGKYSIPLFIYEPGESKGNIHSELIQQVDIPKLVMERLGFSSTFVSFGNTPMIHRYREGMWEFQNDTLLIQMKGKNLQGIFRWKEDKHLKNNLLQGNDTLKFVNEVNFSKAFMQQYTERMKHNQLIIDSK